MTMSTKFPKPKVGDTLYLVPDDYRERKLEVVVSKVGTKNFEIGDHRPQKFLIETWQQSATGGWYPRAKLYPSKEFYDAIQRRKNLWAKIIAFNGADLLGMDELEEMLSKLEGLKNG